MVPLIVVFVVVIVQIGPPGIVVGEDGQRKQYDHRVPNSIFQQQVDQIFGAFIQRYDSDHDQQPHFHRILGGIEVHVLVGSNSRFVGS